LKPTIVDSKTTDGAGAGSFTSDIIGLNGATTYFVSAYATNKVGTGYGMTLSFTTLGQLPTPTTQEATDIGTNGATFNGSINPNYLSTDVSFEYGTSTSYGQTVIAIQSPLSGSSVTAVSSSITGLNTGATYHFRIKAINSVGTTYGSDKTFTTLGEAPIVIIQPATDVNMTSATLNGTINANYLSTNVSFEYGTTELYGNTISAVQSPVIGNSITSVSAEISNLTGVTTYHFRIKAVNSLGTIYSNDLTFTTTGQVPTNITLAATSITTVSATLNGSVNANYLTTTVIFEYGTTSAYGQTVTATQSPVTGSTAKTVNSTITGLTAGTNYHYRIIAVNSLGTTYGDDATFTTVPSTVDDVNGNTYGVITIGMQVWIAENLKTTKYNDGSIIPLVTDNIAWSNLTSSAYCWYNNDQTTFGSTYGALYNFRAAINSKLCPSGWHVPTDDEWIILMEYLGGSTIAGGKLKETGTIHWASPNTGATNETGFTALPGGLRLHYNGEFSSINQYGYWWLNIWAKVMSYENQLVLSNTLTSAAGCSVRCVKDN
jgi:uncharacterized protein (TIGR02145 family)